MTADSTRSVVIGIPVHNRADDLRRLLASLRLLDTAKVDLTVALADDGSEPPLRPLIEKEFGDLDIVFFRNKKPAGPGAARNLIAFSTASEFLWFLDSDVEVVSPGILNRMITLLGSDMSIAAAGGTIEEYGGRKQIVWHRIPTNFLVYYVASERDRFPGSGVDADAFSGGNFFVRRDLFERAGGFREELYRDEDNDLCLALRNMGYRLRVDPGCLLEHHRKARSGSDTGVFTYFASTRSYLRQFLEVRGSLLARHARVRLIFLPLLDLLFTPGILLRVSRGSVKANRLVKAENSRTGDWFRLALLDYPQCYFKGLRLFFSGSDDAADRSSPRKGQESL